MQHRDLGDSSTKHDFALAAFPELARAVIIASVALL
jgi:hypothetical protein